MTSLRFYFDFLSPYAYYARHDLMRIAARHALQIEWLPVDLQRLKLAAGNTGPATVQMPRKLAFALRDFQRWGERYGIAAASRPSCRDVRALNAGTFHAAELGCAERYVELGLAAVWGQGGQPVAPEALLRNVAGDCGIPLDGLRAYVDSPRAHADLEAAFARAEADGAFGVPTVVIGDQLWWGNDRLFMVDEYLAAQGA